MQVNMEGVVVGIVALVMIGVFHPIVIKCEYYFSHRIWPLFLAAGIGFCWLPCLQRGCCL